MNDIYHDDGDEEDLRNVGLTPVIAQQYLTHSFTFISVVIRFEVFTAVTMNNCVFWDVTPCGFCKNQRFGGT
jgi:hypothetical protein